jgi:hypothetical protein
MAFLKTISVHALAVVLAILDKHEQKQWEVFTGHQCWSQLTIAQKRDINNLGRATTDLDISQSSLSRVQAYVRKFNPAVYAKRKCLSGCAERNALLGILFNHTTLTPALP